MMLSEIVGDDIKNCFQLRVLFYSEGFCVVYTTLSVCLYNKYNVLSRVVPDNNFLTQ